MKPAIAAFLFLLALAPAVFAGTPVPDAVLSQAAAPKPKVAVPAKKAPVVGSMDSAPERKLGAAKPPCVYKPVMTNAEIDACR